MECKSIDEFTSPTRKLVRFFQGSRDLWKVKYLALKAQLKLLQNDNRAVRKSRDNWKERALQAERKAQALHQELKKF